MKYIIIFSIIAIISLQATAQEYRTDISIRDQVKNASFPGAVKKEVGPAKTAAKTTQQNINHSVHYSKQLQDNMLEGINYKKGQGNTATAKAQPKAAAGQKASLASDQPYKKDEATAPPAKHVIPSQSNTQTP